jgi:hypothetical protein
MCGRFALFAPASQIAETFGVAPPTSDRPRYNIAPSQDILAIFEDPEDGETKPAEFRWGLIPSFLNVEDERPAREQINDAYIGGWHPMDGWKVEQAPDEMSVTATYVPEDYDPADGPGDPPLQSEAWMSFRDEVLYVLPYDWVVLKGATGEWEVSRLD